MGPAIFEAFTYDVLNRVTEAATDLGNDGVSSVTVTYDALGNITQKSDVAAYTYGSPESP